MARVNRFGFLAIAVAFHLVYIFSIFDIYFVSPIVSGMREFTAERPDGVEAPAQRLVLFVGLYYCYLLSYIAWPASNHGQTQQEMAFEQTKPFNPSQNRTPKMKRISSHGL